MKKFEIILGCVFLLGVILKKVDIPGGIILMALSLIFLILLYFPFSFFLLNEKKLKDIFKKHTYKGIGVYKTIVSIFTGYTFFTFILGVLFIALDYSGKWTVFITGGIWLIFSTIALVIGINTHRHFVMNCLKRVVFLVVIGGVTIILLC